MNQEEQRIAIAEACGWKNADHPDVMKLKHGWTMPEKWCMDPNGVLRFNHDRPNYLNDLNAMHCAEEMFADDQWVEYRENIRTVVLGPVRYVSQWCKADIHSTARQRAEAFLRTIGKWKEAKP